MAFLLSFVTLLTAPLYADDPDGMIEPFQDGETAVFLGDSITHNGDWHSFLCLYYTTRFPERTIRFVNSGVSGGKATDALGRLEWDVFVHNPDHVFIMLGMNDVGTSHFTSDDEEEKTQLNDRMYERYTTRMTEMVEKLRARLPDAQIVLLSATPYDQTGTQERESAFGKNDAIRRQLPFLRTLAGQNDCRFIDLNTLMLEMDRAEKQRDPDFTIVGSDRVHPGPMGHLIMMHAILERTRPERTGMEVFLDARAPSVIRQSAATVSAIEGDASRLAFTVAFDALPYPIDARVWSSGAPSAADALGFVPFASMFNSQLVRLRGLRGGQYRVLADDTLVGIYSTEELAAGVNIAMNPHTPQYAQTRRVMALNSERTAAERDLRSIYWVRARVLLPLGVDPADQEASLAALDEWPQHPDYAEFHSRYLALYRENWPKEDALKAHIAELYEAMRAAAVPAPVRLRVERIDAE
ncbi:MAG: hypothetical protein PWP23_1151 [Candidatus Sumerlaeota bacterium]|nr:hypothetical protein [Candidatus Sumerlaeota bacterium]